MEDRDAIVKETEEIERGRIRLGLSYSMNFRLGFISGPTTQILISVAGRI